MKLEIDVISRLVFYFLFIVFILQSCKKDDLNNFENLTHSEKIRPLDGISVLEINSNIGYGQYQIDIIQPVAIKILNACFQH